LWEYDPVGNSWTQKANFGGIGAFEPVSSVVSDKIFIGAGFDGHYINDWWWQI